jgi:hypothetical protein
MDKTRQTDLVLEYLRRFGSITPAEALGEFGCMRLGARIWDLKRDGHDITMELVQGTNRLGRTVRYARYRLHDHAEVRAAVVSGPYGAAEKTEKAPVAGTTGA